MSRTAAVLVIGNELLSGKIQETNLIELAQLLRSLGIELRRVVFIRDERDQIARDVSSLASSYDYLFTSGGVGPTHDDVTLDGIAAAFDVPIVAHPDLVKLFEQHYGKNLNAGHLRLASIPEGAQLISASASPWPVALMKNVWILPGIPEVFRMKLPIIEEHIQSDRPFITRSVFTKMDEPDLKTSLDQLVDKHSEVDIGSYPIWNDQKYRTKITFDGKDEDLIEKALEDFLALLPEGEPQWIE